MDKTTNNEMKAYLQLDNEIQTTNIMTDNDTVEMMLIDKNGETAALVEGGGGKEEDEEVSVQPPDKEADKGDGCVGIGSYSNIAVTSLLSMN